MLGDTMTKHQAINCFSTQRVGLCIFVSLLLNVYLPDLVMIISVPRDLNWRQRDAFSSSTSISTAISPYTAVKGSFKRLPFYRLAL